MEEGDVVELRVLPLCCLTATRVERLPLGTSKFRMGWCQPLSLLSLHLHQTRP